MSQQEEQPLIEKKALDKMRSDQLDRRQFLRLAALLGISVPAASMVAACGSTGSPPPAPTASGRTSAPSGPQGVLRVAAEMPVQLDPAHASSDTEILIINTIYDYLVDIDENNQLQPRLATEWSQAEDGLEYTFRLAENVTFHDGTPFTSNDVVWTYNRLRDPETELPTADLYSNIKEISAPDDHTVVFKLKEPNPFLPYDLSDNHAVMLKAETEDPASAFNGTGPFRVVDYQPENRMELEANEGYFIEDRPGVGKLKLLFFSENAARVAALRGGQVDLAMRLPTPLFQSLQNEENLTTVNVPTNTFDCVRLRTDREPGNDPRVIKAFKLATDRQAIFNVVISGLGAIGRDSPIGPMYPDYYSEETQIPTRDPEAARTLLAEAGYPDGLKLDLYTPDSGDRPDLAVVLKEQWAEAGIDVNVIVEPESVYYGENHWLEVDLGVTSWGSRPVPQFYVDVMLTCGAKWNESRFCDKEFEELAQVAGTTLDEEERIDAYHEMQRILIERGPIIIPYFLAQFGAISSQFENLRMKTFPGRTDLATIRPKA